MPVDHKRKLAFCHVPRTGGVSISNALELENCGLHLPASKLREMFPDYYLFATYRKWEDRAKSTYGYKLPPGRTEGDLDHAIEEIKDRPKEDKGMMLWPNEYFLDIEVDCLLRYEHLQEDLDKMLVSLGFETVKLIPCNSFKDK